MIFYKKKIECREANDEIANILAFQAADTVLQKESEEPHMLLRSL